jgi:hypothetical protein
MGGWEVVINHCSLLIVSLSHVLQTGTALSFAFPLSIPHTERGTLRAIDGTFYEPERHTKHEPGHEALRLSFPCSFNTTYAHAQRGPFYRHPQHEAFHEPLDIPKPCALPASVDTFYTNAQHDAFCGRCDSSPVLAACSDRAVLEANGGADTDVVTLHRMSLGDVLVRTGWRLHSVRRGHLLG